MAKKKRCTKNINITISPLKEITPEELEHVIARAIVEAETIKNRPPNPINRKITAKRLFKIMFGRLNRMTPQNSIISLAQIIVIPICNGIKWIGYIISILVFLSAISAVICQFSISQLFASLLFVSFAIAIWLIARLFGAASVEIEKTNSPELAYNFASFFLAIIAIVTSIIK